VRCKVIYDDETTWKGRVADFDASPDTKGPGKKKILNIIIFLNDPYRFHLSHYDKFFLHAGPNAIRAANWNVGDVRGTITTISKTVMEAGALRQRIEKFRVDTLPATFQKANIRHGAKLADNSPKKKRVRELAFDWQFGVDDQ
jgi:hypothetical protein